MKSWRIVAVLVLCLALAGSTACGLFNGGEEAVGYQLAEVVRGDLVISVSGSGNIFVSNEATLVFGVSGRIDKIFVDENDEVAEGEVLAELNTDALELALLQAQIALEQARYNLDQAKYSQDEAEYSLDQAEYNLDEVEYSLYQAEYSLDEAEYSLDQAVYNLDQAEYSLDEAEYNCHITEVRFSLDLVSKVTLEMAEERVRMAEDGVTMAEERVRMAEEGVTMAEERVRMAEDEVTMARERVRMAEDGVMMARGGERIAEMQLEAVEQALEQAQKNLDEATITAPFDGVVASVNVDEGDTISTATPIIHLIDLISMELKAGVDEIDIPSVKPNQRAIIEVDALPDLQLEGKVSSISLIPTEQGGLIIYDVTISFDVPEDSEVKVGMSATADIIIHKRDNVLLLSARAIKQDSSGNPVVKVMVNEEIQEIPVVIGISDGLDTEIVSGLQEGEIVVIETRPKTTGSGGPFGG